MLYLPFIVIGRFHNELSKFAYWRNRIVKKNFMTLKQYFDEDRSLRPALIIAHDYQTAPIADIFSKRFLCPYSVDVHEYAKEQYNHSRWWRAIFKPWVYRIQHIYLSKSAFNTTVCDSIADLIEKDYAPLARPTVLRSMPSYIEMPFRPTEEKITVLYNGIIYPSRGLDMAIESLPLWRPEFHLVIRGPADVAYIEILKQKAHILGVEGRVKFESPVLFRDIIPTSNQADIGYFIQGTTNAQKRFALPNKFFEYISAGLALCIGNMPEMTRIMNRYDLGKIANEYTAENIAATINSFTRDQIDTYKKNNLLAAKELCWEKESFTMLQSYNNITQG